MRWCRVTLGLCTGTVLEGGSAVCCDKVGAGEAMHSWGAMLARARCSAPCVAGAWQRVGEELGVPEIA